MLRELMGCPLQSNSLQPDSLHVAGNNGLKAHNLFSLAGFMMVGICFGGKTNPAYV